MPRRRRRRSSRSLSRTAGTIEPVKEKRLELGKKVFKVPTQSKRKSSRIQRPVVQLCQIKTDPSELFHHLFLAPTLKRQRKKKLERERKTKRQRRKYHSRMSIHISDVFPKKCKSSKRRQSGDRMISIILDDTELQFAKRTRDMSDSVKIRHLARCGGVKSVSGFEDFFEKFDGSKQESEVPPPFDARDDDTYIIPQPGQLVSYLWHTRPSPVLGRKTIYRTGILCATDGTIRFFESDDDCVENNNKDRKYFEGRFYLNKQVFKLGNFRVRTDLVEGAVCYERDRKIPCKIIKIDEESGAVLVESLETQKSGMNQMWISPDDLVGNYTPKNNAKKQNRQPSNNKTKEIGLTSQTCVSSINETIDLTEDDEDETNYGLYRPTTVAPRQVSADSLSYISPETQAQMKSITAIIADACDSLSSESDLPSNGYSSAGSSLIENLYENQFRNTTERKSWLPETTQSRVFRFTNNNLTARNTSSMLNAATLGSSFRGQPRLGMVETSSPIPSQENVTIRSEVDLLNQNRRALQILMSANDLGTIVASLQFIKRLHQRGVAMGPTATKVMSDAELTSRAMMEEAFLSHMTAPIWSGGKGYDILRARRILCRLAPVLGSNLGRLDSPIIDSAKLMILGLSGTEATGLIEFIQKIEEDILRKNIDFKRQFAGTSDRVPARTAGLQPSARGIFNSYRSFA